MAGGDMVVNRCRFVEVVIVRRGDRPLFPCRRWAKGWMVGVWVTDLFLKVFDGQIGNGR